MVGTTMNLKVCLLALAGAAAAAASLIPIFAAAVVHPRQQDEDTMDLYLCSNPNFNHDCIGCACERLANLSTTGGYGGPPCCTFTLSPFSTRCSPLPLSLSYPIQLTIILPHPLDKYYTKCNNG
jgi:hypothetical protein